MRVEEMALRSEIRQMLNEAGYNKNTVKLLVKEVLQEELEKAIKQAMNESDLDGYIRQNVDSIIYKKTENVLEKRITSAIVGDWFHRMKVDVSIEGVDNLYDSLQE